MALTVQCGRKHREVSFKGADALDPRLRNAVRAEPYTVPFGYVMMFESAV